MVLKRNTYFIATALLFILSSVSYGQSKTYFVKVYGAYGLFTPGSFKPVSSAVALDNDQNSIKVPRLGMGAGVRVGAGIGMVINDFLNIGLDGEYHIGTKMTGNTNYSGTNWDYKSETILDYTIFSIIPNITFKAISQPDYYVYTRLGLLIGIPLEMTGEENTIDEYTDVINGIFTSTSTYTKTTYELKTSLGYQVAIGVQVRISDAVRAFGEIVAYGISFNRNRDVQTEKYTDPLSSQIPENKRIIVYESEGEYTTLEKLESDGTTTTTRTIAQNPANANAIAISIGIAFKL